MAWSTVTTEEFKNGDNSNKDFTFAFPYLQNDDVKVQLLTNNIWVDNTAWSFHNTTTIRFTTAPPSGTANVRIYRDTEVDVAKAVYAAGSSVRAKDLNDNQDQALYALQEEQFNKITTNDIRDGTIMNVDINGDAEIAVAKLANGTARQVLQTNVGGQGVVWTSNVDLPGTLDVTSTANFDAAVNISGAAGVDGNFDVNTNKFTVASATGNTVVAGTLSVDGATEITDDLTVKVDNKEFSIQNASGSDKFTVDTDNGNTVIAGTLTSNGSSQFKDNVVLTADNKTFTIENASGTDKFTVDSDNGNTTIAGTLNVSGQITGNVTGNVTGSADKLTTPRTIGMTGDVVWTSPAFDGSGNVTAASTIQANAVQIGNISDTETTLTSNSNVKLPTSKAVADFISNTVTPLGGFEAIDNEDSFPADNPAAGVIISIANATGITVDSSGVSETARQTGSGSDDVKITDFPSTLTGGSGTNANPFPLPDNTGLLVIATGTQSGGKDVYKYHRLLPTTDDVKQLSDDVNDFFARYRIAASAPGTDNDDGDLYWDTGAHEMKVYNAGTSTWEAMASTASSSIATLSPTPDGSEVEFTSSVAPKDAASTIISVNGVIQKPNSGTNITGSDEGFCITAASKIKFATAPLSTDSIFVVILGATTSIGTPSLNVIDETHFKHQTAGDIIYYAASGVPSRLAKGTDGHVLKLASGLPTWASHTSGLTDIVSDTTPQLGGNLDVQDKTITTSTTNGDIAIVPNGTGDVVVGTGSAAAEIKASGAQNLQLRSSNAYINIITGANGGVQIVSDGTGAVDIISGSRVTKFGSGAVEETLTTHSSGAHIKIEPAGTSGNIRVKSGANEDIEITPNGTGDVVIDGLKYPQADGSAGQVLKTDGSAQLSWVNQSAGTITALNNQAENRLVSIGNTTTELDGEANLTFQDTTSTGLICGKQVTARGFEAPATVTDDWTIAAGNNAMFPGPMTIDTGKTVTVPANRTLTVV